VLEAEIYITLKKTVLDPQGLVIKHALDSLGYSDVKEVRIGKLIKVSLGSDDKKEAMLEAEEICRKLLANPIIEDYKVSIKERG
jgi:phosphoribosylformylglycinamidine synthase subunit PurS